MASQKIEQFSKEELLVLDENDISELWKKLGPELKAVASRFLGAGRSVEDSLGIANAAFHSLIRAIDAKDLVQEDQQIGLWPVLIETIDARLLEDQPEKDNAEGLEQSWVFTTLRRIGFKIAQNKAHQAGRRELAAKRGGNWTRTEVEPNDNPQNSSPAALAEFEELLAILKKYGEESKQPHMNDILRLKLQELSSKEIATSLGISEATVCRRLKELHRFIEELAPSTELDGEQVDFVTTTVRAYCAMRIPNVLKRVLSADDVVQETLIRLMNKGNKLNFGSAQSRSLICTIANRVIIDRLRAETADKRSPKHGRVISHQGTSSSSMLLPMPQGNVETPSRILMRDEAREVIGKAALKVLSEKEKLIFFLKYDEGLSNEEVGLLLDLTESAVRNIDYRLRKKIASALARTPEFESRAHQLQIFQIELLACSSARTSLLASVIEKDFAIPEENVKEVIRNLPHKFSLKMNYATASQLARKLIQAGAKVEIIG